MEETYNEITPLAPVERNWAMYTHLSGLIWVLGIPGIIGPLIFWAIKKDTMPFVSAEGKEAMNFQLSMIIYSLISAPLCFVLIGFVSLFAVLIMTLVFPILAGIAANEGKSYRYPLIFRLIT